MPGRYRSLHLLAAAGVLLGFAVLWALYRGDAGFPRSAPRPEALADDTAPEPDVPAIRMTGQIVDGRGFGIPGATVHCCPWGEEAGGGVRVLLSDGEEFPCDAHGRFLIPDREGALRAAWVVRAAGYRLHYALAALLEGRVVLSESAPLRVEVRLDGEPLDGARVVWAGEIAANAHATIEGRTDARGSCVITGVTGGSVKVDPPLPGMESRRRRVDSAHVLFEFTSGIALVARGQDGQFDHDAFIAVVSRRSGHVRRVNRGAVLHLSDEQSRWPDLDAVAWSETSPPVRRAITGEDGSRCAASPVELRLRDGSEARLTVTVSCPPSGQREEIRVDLAFDDARLFHDAQFMDADLTIASRTGAAPGIFEFVNLPRVRFRGTVVSGGSAMAWFEVDPDQTMVECAIAAPGSLKITNEKGEPPPIWAEFTVGNQERSFWQIIRKYRAPVMLPPGEYHLWFGAYVRNEVVRLRDSLGVQVRSGETSTVRIPIRVPVECVARAVGGLLSDGAATRFELQFELMGDEGVVAYQSARSKHPASDAWKFVPVSRQELAQGVRVRLEPGTYRAMVQIGQHIDSRLCSVDEVEKQVLLLDFGGATRTIRVNDAESGKAVADAQVSVGTYDGSWSARTTDEGGIAIVPAFMGATTYVHVSAESMDWAGECLSVVRAEGGRRELLVPIGPYRSPEGTSRNVRFRLLAPEGACPRSVSVGIFAVRTSESGDDVARFVDEVTTRVGADGVTDALPVPVSRKIQADFWSHDRVELVGNVEIEGDDVLEGEVIAVELTER